MHAQRAGKQNASGNILTAADIINWMVFESELTIGMPLLEKCIFVECYLWRWPLNPWPWK